VANLTPRYTVDKRMGLIDVEKIINIWIFQKSNPEFSVIQPSV
jgi:hypothetical protein